MPSTAKPAADAAPAPPPTLRQRAITALFGEVSGMGIRHTLLQFLSLGEDGERRRERNSDLLPRSF
jgi:hypothetical protein